MRELKKSDLEKVIQEHQNDIENKQKELTNLQENNTTKGRSKNDRGIGLKKIKNRPKKDGSQCPFVMLILFQHLYRASNTSPRKRSAKEGAS